MKRMKPMEEQKGFSLTNSFVLGLMTFGYIIGEVAHFQIGSVSRDMARDIEFGIKKCYENQEVDTNSTLELTDTCKELETETNCVNYDDPMDNISPSNGSICYWDYSGQGIAYQVLAGPIFVVIFTSCAILTGFFGDKFSRTKLMSFCIMLFSVCGCLMAFAQEYWHLLLLRIGIAAGEAACRPVASSLIADLFDPKTRGVANGIFSWGIYIGYGMTFILGNNVAQADIGGYGWRSVFILGCVWGIPCAIILFFFVDPRNMKKKTESAPIVAQEGIRRDSDSSSGSQSRKEEIAVELTKEEKKKKSREYWRNVLKAMIQLPMLLLLFAASVRHLAGFAWSFNSQIFLDEYYDDFEPGIWMAMCSIIGGSFGVFFGGWFSDLAIRKLGLYSRLWILSACLAAATPFAVGVLLLEPPGLFYMLLTYYFFAETWFAILFTVIAEIVPLDVRAIVIGIFLFIMNNIGGNLVIIVDPVAQKYDYRTALLIFFPGMVGASAILFFISSLPLYFGYKKESQGAETIEEKQDKEGTKDMDTIQDNIEATNAPNSQTKDDN